MNDPSRRQRFREALRTAGISLGMALLTLAALEVVLRVADFRMLREGTTERSLSYRYDPELGWAALPNSDSVASNVRTVHVHHNSLGLRDSEFSLDGRPTMLFLGDSFVWGLDAEPDERFTELLKPRVAGYKILSAGVSAFNVLNHTNFTNYIGTLSSSRFGEPTAALAGRQLQFSMGFQF